MTEKEAIMSAIKARGVTQKMLAEQCGYKRQSNFTSLMSGKSMTVGNFVKMLDALGFDLVVKDRNKANRDNNWKIDQHGQHEVDGGDGE